MRFHVADEDVPIFTFSPPVKDAESVDITYIFSEPIKVCQHFTGVMRVQGGPSALGKNYVDTKVEVAFSCKFILWPRPTTELRI